MNTSPSLTITQAAARMGCGYTTFLLWQSQNLAPRRIRLGKPHRDRVAVDELELWLGQRERDRVATGKPHLRKPLRPLSWTPEGALVQFAEQLERVAHAGTTASPSARGPE